MRLSRVCGSICHCLVGLLVSRHSHLWLSTTSIHTVLLCTITRKGTVSLMSTPGASQPSQDLNPDQPGFGFWYRHSYAYIHDKFPAANLASQWFLGRIGMHCDGMDYAGQIHPAFIRTTWERHFQRKLITNEILDTVSVFRMCNCMPSEN